MDNRNNRHNRRKYSVKVHIVIVTKYRKLIFWSDVYFACSIEEVSSSTIQKYIESQG